MGDKFKNFTGVTIAAFITLLAGAGKGLGEFFTSLQGFPALMSAWSSGLPHGFWSVLLSWAVGMVAYGLASHWLPDSKGARRAAETIAIIISIAVTIQQAHANAASMLTAVWLGLGAGYAAAYVAKRVGASLPKKPELGP